MGDQVTGNTLSAETQNKCTIGFGADPRTGIIMIETKVMGLSLIALLLNGRISFKAILSVRSKGVLLYCI